MNKSYESKRCVTALHQMAKPLETMTASLKTKTVKINAITASMKADRNELKK
jgi:septal ring factor EnvC (AmiA/AmiB activator)